MKPLLLLILSASLYANTCTSLTAPANGPFPAIPANGVDGISWSVARHHPCHQSANLLCHGCGVGWDLRQHSRLRYGLPAHHGANGAGCDLVQRYPGRHPLEPATEHYLPRTRAVGAGRELVHRYRSDFYDASQTRESDTYFAAIGRHDAANTDGHALGLWLQLRHGDGDTQGRVE